MHELHQNASASTNREHGERHIHSEKLSMLSYKPNYSEVLDRLRSLYSRQASDRIFATMSIPSETLESFRAAYPDAECSYPDPRVRADFWDRLFRERSTLEDDSLPSAYLSEFDQGLYGGLLGGDVRFMAHTDVGWISSMVPPLLKNWDEFDRLYFDAGHPWWRCYLDQMQIFTEQCRGKWGISHFILIDALNFVFELLGATKTYLSLDERPEMIHRAIDFGFDLNCRVQQAFFDTVGLFEGGTFSNFGQWIPGRILSESLDPYHMTSVAYFEKWGREPVERIFDAFDGGVIHIHGNGRHLLKAASSIRGLKAILLLDDLGFPKAFDVLRDLQSQTGDMPLAVFVDYENFVERLRRHDLPGGVIYQVKIVPNAATANNLMEEVRGYRR